MGKIQFKILYSFYVPTAIIIVKPAPKSLRKKNENGKQVQVYGVTQEQKIAFYSKILI